MNDFIRLSLCLYQSLWKGFSRDWPISVIPFELVPVSSDAYACYRVQRVRRSLGRELRHGIVVGTVHLQPGRSREEEHTNADIDGQSGQQDARCQHILSGHDCSGNLLGIPYELRGHLPRQRTSRLENVTRLVFGRQWTGSHDRPRLRRCCGRPFGSCEHSGRRNGRLLSAFRQLLFLKVGANHWSIRFEVNRIFFDSQ